MLTLATEGAVQEFFVTLVISIFAHIQSSGNVIAGNNMDLPMPLQASGIAIDNSST
jgi:hypothetical protein